MKSDYYLDEAKKKLTEACRIINMSAPEYYKEIVERNPRNGLLFKVDDMWAYRTGVIQNKVEGALQMLERIENKEENNE